MKTASVERMARATTAGKADSYNIRNMALPFPEYGSPTYLDETLRLGLWRRRSRSAYPPARVKALLTEAAKKRKQASVPHDCAIHSEAFEYLSQVRALWR